MEEKYGKESTQAQEIGKQITAIQNDIDRTYGIGSEKGMAIRAVTAALQAAAQNDTAGSLVALASPYLNKTIHEMTAGDTAKDKAANLMAHALLSAVEFQVTGKDPLTGAVAGVTGEATAEIIARAYGKPVSELTANEKENISTLSQLAGGLAAALTAKVNGVSNQNGGGMALAVAGAETSKRAVENNFGFIEATRNPEYIVGLHMNAQADEIIKQAEDKAIENALDRGLPQYIALDAGVYKFGGKIAINTRTGDVFYSQAPTLSVISGPNLSTKLGFGIEMGWIPTLDHNEIQDIGRSINNVLGGASIGGKACYGIYCVSASSTLPTGPKNKTHQTMGFGLGGGYSLGVEVMKRWGE